MKLFKNKYRTDTIRLKEWNYSSPADYFVTICTKEMKSWFGEIVGGEMQYSKVGLIAKEEIENTPKIRPYVHIEGYVVMPNHVHILITIMPIVETRSFASLQQGNVFGKQSHNLASIIRGYKSSVTIQSRNISPTFSWQPRYYETVILNPKHLQKTQNYIQSNPYLWTKDPYFSY